MEPTTTYDIFSGSPSKEAIWQCAVQGLENAQQRMKQMATDIPGKYFIFSATKSIVMSTLNTTKVVIEAQR